MNKFLVVPVIAVIVISVFVYLLLGENSTEPQPSIGDAGFAYYDIDDIQDTLAQQNITVSTPVAITDHTINRYCTYFENGVAINVEYCTTTAVLDSQGNALGNINIGGDLYSPVMAVTNLETATLESNSDDVFAVFEAVIETLVCDCWADQKSEDYESISSWLEAAHTFSRDSDNRNIKSKIDNLGDSEISLEITFKDNSVLQTLIIVK